MFTKNTATTLFTKEITMPKSRPPPKKKSGKKPVKGNLKGKQSQLDKNKNGKIDKQDFQLMRKGGKKKGKKK